MFITFAVHPSKKIEGFKVVRLEFQRDKAWIIYKSTENPRLFRMRSCYYDELPFGNLVMADTDSSATNNKDSFTDNSRLDTNFGSYPIVECTRAGANPTPTVTRYSYTEWTMPSNSGTISSVVLKIYVCIADNSGDWGDFYICHVSDSWYENTITWNNAPGGLGVIHSMWSSLLPDSNGWYEWELEDDSVISGQGLVPYFGVSWGDTFTVRFFIAWKSDGSGVISHCYYSRTYETTSIRPVLIITYTS